MLTRLMKTVVVGVLALFVSAAGGSLLVRAEEVAEASKPLVFRKLTDEDRKDLDKAGLTIGEYVIVADAVKQLRKVATLELKLNTIQHFDWSQPQWDKQEAEQTIHRVLNIHIDKASARYSGMKIRGDGTIAPPDEKYIDVDLGDLNLSHALMDLVKGTMWGVPLEVGQEARINTLIQQRLDLIATKKGDDLQFAR